MRILIIPSWYPTPKNPVHGIFIREQVDALHEAHEVRVLYLELLPRGHQEPAQHHTSQERGYIEEWLEVPSHPLIWRFTYLWYLLRAFRALRHQFTPDVIHTHIALPAGWGAVVLRPLFRAPIVLTENMSEFRPWLARRSWRWMAGYTFRHADAVIAVSEGLRERIQQTFHRTRPTLIIPNIVDTTRFVPSPLPAADNGYRLLFVGLMETSQKGISVLLEALAQLQHEGNLNLHLDLIGDGVLRPTYEVQAQHLGLTESLTFHGLQSHAMIAEMLQKSHVLVLPSLHEALPLVIIEALASGRPVITTRCGGPEYMIDTTNGLVVEPGQATPLAKAIHELLNNLDQYQPQSIATAAAQLYSHEAVRNALTQAYSDLMTSQMHSTTS